MESKVCECGCGEFSAHQLCRVDVVVDGNNIFERNLSNDMESSCYDSETPYGPYECMKCGKEYDNLSELSTIKYSKSIQIEAEKLNEILNLDYDSFKKSLNKKSFKINEVLYSSWVEFDDVEKHLMNIKVTVFNNGVYVEYILCDKDKKELCYCTDKKISKKFMMQYLETFYEIIYI